MPTLAIFDGIKITMYADDHNPPHFHAEYGEYSAIIKIDDLTIHIGELPKKVYKKVKEWAVDKQAILSARFIELNPHLR